MVLDILVKQLLKHCDNYLFACCIAAITFILGRHKKDAKIQLLMSCLTTIQVGCGTMDLLLLRSSNQATIQKIDKGPSIP